MPVARIKKQPPKSPLDGVLERVTAQQAQGSLWSGPNGQDKNGGVTQGLIAKWCTCKERTRLLLVDGIKPVEGWNHRLEYGQMWHICEEALASERSHFGEVVGTTLWEENLEAYAKQLLQKYPMDRVEVEKYYECCRIQFPLYVQHWAKHPDVQARTPLLQEHEFSVPYQLPSGRTVRLRGKMDSVDLVEGGIWLQENKSKGQIDEQKIKSQLGSGMELQVMFYLVALGELMRGNFPAPAAIAHIVYGLPIKGVRFNVVRRPLSQGNQGSIVQHQPTKGSKCPKCGDGEKALKLGCPKCLGAGRINAKPGETREAYFERLRVIMAEDPGPEYFFMRWNVEITEDDIQRFRRESLDPILENLCWWHEEMVVGGNGKYHKGYGPPPCHWRTPYFYNPLAEGRSAELDKMLDEGQRQGLRRTEVLFPELSN